MLEMRNQYDFFLNTTLDFYHIFTLDLKKEGQALFLVTIVFKKRSSRFIDGGIARASRPLFCQYDLHKW
jgi:hypothetical protein